MHLLINAVCRNDDFYVTKRLGYRSKLYNIEYMVS